MATESGWILISLCHQGFSQYGNLTETLIALVRHSPAGLSAAELGRLLGMEPRSFLWLFRNHPALTREKHHGRFVYFAAEPVWRRPNLAVPSCVV